MTTQHIEVKRIRGKFYLYAGKAKLSTGYPTHAYALAAYEDDKELIHYWANSAGVSVQNAEPVVVEL